MSSQTPPSVPTAGLSSASNGSSTPIPQRKASASHGRPRQESEVIKDLCPHPIDLHWPSQLRMGRGLSNNGNTCFLNSVLQCLLYTPPLLHILARHPHKECSLMSRYLPSRLLLTHFITHVGNIRPWCATCALNMIMVRNFSNERGYFSPTVITKHIKCKLASSSFCITGSAGTRSLT